MDNKQYIKEALTSESVDFEAIKGRLSDEKTIRGLHASVGLVTEAAEFIDVFKKHIFYGREIDWINLEEEIGDIFWYIAIMTDVMGYDDFEGFLAKNNAKLLARYKGKYSDEGANNRDLKTERSILENK